MQRADIKKLRDTAERPYLKRQDIIGIAETPDLVDYTTFMYVLYIGICMLLG